MPTIISICKESIFKNTLKILFFLIITSKVTYSGIPSTTKQTKTTTSTTTFTTVPTTTASQPKVCPPGTKNDGNGTCIYHGPCGNIAMDIQGTKCTPSDCETSYGPCSCLKGYLNDTYGCICDCPVLNTTTLVCQPGQNRNNLGVCENTQCASLAYGNDGVLCQPNECESLYGACQCNDGYLPDTYGCICDCSSLLPQITPQTIVCPPGTIHDGYGACIYNGPCGNIAMDIQGIKCTASDCETSYGPCSCLKGYLNDTYGCICECNIRTTVPTTTTLVCQPGQNLNNLGVCENTRCASLAYGIDGVECQPNECESLYGACQCNDGYLPDTYGCICDCSSLLPQITLKPIVCPPGAINDGNGTCIYHGPCGNIAMDIQGIKCTPKNCETAYGPCSCLKGYLNDTYGCICDCPVLNTTTLVCQPGQNRNNLGVCENTQCASLAYGNDGVLCQPNECESLYGACQCNDGYLPDTYGCICDCSSHLSEITPQTIVCPPGTIYDGYGRCIHRGPCGNIAMDVQGIKCTPSDCETAYGPCSCLKGYLNDTYGCICDCPLLTTTTTVCPPGQYLYFWNKCGSDIQCASVEYEISGADCPPNACEMFYGTCQCEGGYLRDTYGCRCECPSRSANNCSSETTQESTTPQYKKI